MSTEAVFFAAYVFLMFSVLAAILAGQEGLGLLLVLIAGGCAAATIYFGSVEGRAPSPSPGVATATPAVSEMAPARPLEAGVSGSQGTGRADSDLDHPVWSAVEGGGAASERPAPASTVTQSALTEGGDATGRSTAPNPLTPSRPTVTASPADGGALTPSAVPATPVTTSPAVVTQGAKSDISALIAASPWPQYLWGTVACLVERESKGNAVAVGLAGERGLMQVHPITWPYLAQYGITPDALFDPATNLRAGYLLFIEAGGLRPWGGGCNA